MVKIITNQSGAKGFVCQGQFITDPSIILPPDPNAGNCTSAEWSGVLSALISGIEVNNCEINNVDRQ